MATLTNTQLIVLSTAAQRQDGGVIPPERLKGNAAQKTVARLVALGLIEEVGAHGSLPVWRRDDEGNLALRITSAGLAAIGVEPEGDDTSSEPDDGEGEQPSDGEPAMPDASPLPSRTGQPRAGTKQALVVERLSAEAGASLDELITATGWLPHTTRAALTGLRRKGYAITKAKDENGPTRYRIVQGGAAPDGAASDQPPATEPAA